MSILVEFCQPHLKVSTSTERNLEMGVYWFETFGEASMDALNVVNNIISLK